MHSGLIIFLIIFPANGKHKVPTIIYKNIMHVRAWTQKPDKMIDFYYIKNQSGNQWKWSDFVPSYQEAKLPVFNDKGE